MPQFFDPSADIEVHRNFLPHWQQSGATYFITYHLADSIPESLLSAWRLQRAAWLAHHLPPWSAEIEDEYHRRFSKQIDRWLDAAHGSYVLKRSRVRIIAAETLRHSDGSRYNHHAWVIMPNHVHVLASLHEGRKLQQEIGAWKSISARRINQELERCGALW